MDYHVFYFFWIFLLSKSCVIITRNSWSGIRDFIRMKYIENDYHFYEKKLPRPKLLGDC